MSAEAHTRTPRRVPRGTIERMLRVTTSLLVLGIGVALLVVPGAAEGAAADRPWPIEPRAARIAAGTGLILLLLVREGLALRRR